jgi:hypothetical protein
MILPVTPHGLFDWHIEVPASPRNQKIGSLKQPTSCRIAVASGFGLCNNDWQMANRWMSGV